MASTKQKIISPKIKNFATPFCLPVLKFVKRIIFQGKRFHPPNEKHPVNQGVLYTRHLIDKKPKLNTLIH